MGKNIRNTPCWCGSGLKYKKCHYAKNEQNPATREDIEKALRKRIKICMAPDFLKKSCSQKISKAHTISKSSSLKAISQESHVIGYLKPDRSDGILKRISINKASTFRGFCSKHDNELFQEIENNKNFNGGEKQLLLLAYRALCMELYAKQTQEDLIRFMRQGADKGKNITEQLNIQSFAEAYSTGVNLAIRDFQYIKNKLEEMFINKESNILDHYIFKLNGIASIVSSGCVAPEVNFKGKRIQSLWSYYESPEKGIPNYIIFNLVSFNDTGYFIFSYLKEHSTLINEFISSLINHQQKKIGNLITGFLYSYCENTFASPLWWDSLSKQLKEKIKERIQHGGLERHPIDCLIDDNLEYNAIDIASYYRKCTHGSITDQN